MCVCLGVVLILSSVSDFKISGAINGKAAGRTKIPIVTIVVTSHLQAPIYIYFICIPFIDWTWISGLGFSVYFICQGLRAMASLLFLLSTLFFI